MKRSIVMIGICLILSITSLSTVKAEEEQDNIQLAEDAKAALLIERDSGKVLYDKNAHEKLPPASMTKIMTLLLIMEALESDVITLEEEITISENAASMGGSQVFLAAGEVMTVDNLIKAIAIASGNDASVALAERIAGSEEAFVQMMNDRAEQLQLENTHFENASGLPVENHYTTAYDMGMIAKELLKFEEIVSYTSIYEDYLRKGEENEFWLVNTNKLVHFSPYVDGLKTGYTSEAMYCLTATAKKDDMRVISVVMGAENTKERNAMTMNLIDYAFNQYESEKLYEKGEQVAELSLLHAKDNHYNVVTSEPISLLHEKGKKQSVQWQSEVQLNDTFGDLPIKKGETVGTLIIKEADEIVHQSDLHVQNEVNKADYLTLLKRSIAYIAKNHE